MEPFCEHKLFHYRDGEVSRDHRKHYPYQKIQGCDAYALRKVSSLKVSFHTQIPNNSRNGEQEREFESQLPFGALQKAAGDCSATSGEPRKTCCSLRCAHDEGFFVCDGVFVFFAVLG